MCIAFQRKKHLLVSLIIISYFIITNSERIMLSELPINPVLTLQLENRLNRLLRYLQKKHHRNSWELYFRVRLCERYLEQLERQTMMNYENVMIGRGNRVRGIRNIILGEKNKLWGKKNWIFTANYQGKVNHTLILDKWKIDLDKMESIKRNPKIAITQWHHHH